MQKPLRNTGIDDLGNMAWGTHFCVFYETKQDLIDTVAPFFRAGLEANEFCLWVVPHPLTTDEAKTALREAIPDLNEYLAANSIEIVPRSDWYVKGGRFDRERVILDWYKRLDGATRRGYSGMRASGDAFWTDPNDWKSFIEYEQELNNVLAGRPIVLLCSYPLATTPAVDLADAMRAHNFTLARRNGTSEILQIPSDAEKARAISERAAKTALERLAPREREVLAEIVFGAQSKDIASRLGIAESTVNTYRTRLLLKTNARNMADLVRLAISGGMVNPVARRPWEPG